MSIGGKHTEFTFGPEYHVKSEADAAFATLDSGVEGIIADKVIDDLPVLVESLKSWAGNCPASPYGAKFIIEEFWPEEKSRYTFHDLKEPCSILMYFVTITVSAYCHHVFSFVTKSLSLSPGQLLACKAAQQLPLQLL